MAICGSLTSMIMIIELAGELCGDRVQPTTFDHTLFTKTNQEQDYFRFQHLEKAESQAHIDGVLAVVRRPQIDELMLGHR